MKIFLDLDGVLADFEKHFYDVFDVRHDKVSDEVLWEKIHGHENFFRELPVMPGGKDFFEAVIETGFDYDSEVMILTACPKEDYMKYAKQKIEWVREHLCDDIHILPVLGGKNKALFMSKPGDVLIDDFSKNLKSWTKHGGYSILHRSNDLSYSELEDYMHGTYIADDVA